MLVGPINELLVYKPIPSFALRELSKLGGLINKGIRYMNHAM